MLLKKTALLGATLAVLNAPLATYANLETNNYTDENSAVKVLSSGICSGNLGFYTPARPTKEKGSYGHLSTTPFSVRVLCNGANPCSADIYMTKDCSGDKVATASIDTNTINIIKVQNVEQSKYIAIGSGSTVEIHYKNEN